MSAYSRVLVDTAPPVGISDKYNNSSMLLLEDSFVIRYLRAGGNIENKPLLLLL
jgi:hypothetical protein